MSTRIVVLIAILLLTLMGTVGFFSMQNDALTFDELAHIPAGYSYLTQQDYRINPEHPPLIKDISAIPLLFQNLNFPSDTESWQQTKAPQWWVQFDLGTEFLYRSDNNPQNIITAARLPLLLLMLFMGGFLFWWTRKLAGNLIALGVLILFVFSPSFIAHGRLVTTDVAAAFGVIFSFYFWLKFIKKPTLKNIIIAGITLGIALSFKFSLLLLIPVLGITTLLYPLLKEPKKERIKAIGKYFGYAVLAGLIGVVIIIWPLYQFHIINYTAERQVRDTTFDLQNTPEILSSITNFTIWSADKPVLRPLAQYMRGILMAVQRTTFGNTVYFLGNIAAGGWWYYFPVIYLLKIPLALHILSLFALLGVLWFSIKRWHPVQWMKNNIELTSFLLFLGIYWGSAMVGNLNIGIRHLLPTFPFIYILTLLGIKYLFHRIQNNTAKFLFKGGVVLLFSWYIISSLLTFPTYISYFNEIGGGTNNGYKYAVDSNYDWGQDFYLLLDFVEENNIQMLSLDYFGGENPSYYLKDKVRSFNPKTEQPTGWVAVSLNELQGGQATPDSSFINQESGYYNWLIAHEPVARIGTSIFIYYID